MSTIIARKTELHICKKLREAIPGITVIPFHGGGETDDAFETEPPFAVVAVSSAEKMMGTESTYLVDGSVQWVTHLSETTPQNHAQGAKAVKDALNELIAASESDFAFHGIDISTEERAEDQSSRARADVIRFKAGVGG